MTDTKPASVSINVGVRAPVFVHMQARLPINRNWTIIFVFEPCLYAVWHISLPSHAPY